MRRGEGEDEDKGPRMAETSMPATWLVMTLLVTRMVNGEELEVERLAGRKWRRSR